MANLTQKTLLATGLSALLVAVACIIIDTPKAYFVGKVSASVAMGCGIAGGYSNSIERRKETYQSSHR